MLHFLTVLTGMLLCGFLAAHLCSFTLHQFHVARSHRSAERLARLQAQQQLAQLQQRARLAEADQLAWRGWRTLQVAQLVDESPDCRSFYLTATDQTPLPPFQPGQYVMIGCQLEPEGPIVTRCYSLSDAPDARYYRITVKRIQDGAISRHLHEQLRVEDRLLVGAPRGKFVLSDTARRPVIGIAAGIGITPILSMTRFAANWYPERQVLLYYQARDRHHCPFLSVLRKWEAACPNLRVVTCFSQPGCEDRPNFRGRLDAQTVLRDSQLPEGEFFLCGPNGFIKSLQSGLRSQGIPADAIRIESFGGAKPSARPSGAAPAPTTAAKTSVTFRESKRTVQAQANQSLLEIAEEHSVAIDSGCRAGQCGSCVVRVLKGRCHYEQPPECDLEAGEVASCIACPLGDVEIDA